MLVILEYIIVASLVVYFSIKASQYIDMLDKTTELSGAFLGGVLLSAVTSLPELFTSISATVLLNKPSLCIGNILGSDLFNLAMLATVSLIAISSFRRARISKGNILVTLFVILIYAVLILKWFNILDFEIATLNIVTIIIVLLYAIGVRYLAGNKSESEEDDKNSITLSTRQIVTRFTLVSIGIVLLSVVMTYVTDDLATQYNIGMGLAGAIFLGVATSLPEVSSTIALFRMKSYDIAVGNIIGSNIFNIFFVAGVSSFFYPLTFTAEGNLVDACVALGAALLLYALSALKGHKLNKIGGAVMLLCFAGYYTYLFLI